MYFGILGRDMHFLFFLMSKPWADNLFKIFISRKLLVLIDTVDNLTQFAHVFFSSLFLIVHIMSKTIEPIVFLLNLLKIKKNSLYEFH